MQLLIAVHILTFPTFRRRKYYCLKALLLALPLIIADATYHCFFPDGVGTTGFKLDSLLILIPLGYVYCYTLVCYHCSAREALFSLSSAQLIQTITFNLQNLLRLGTRIPMDSEACIIIACVTMLAVYIAGYYLFKSWMKTREGHILPKNKVILRACLITLLAFFSSWQVNGEPRTAGSNIAYIFCGVFALIMQIGLLHETDLSLKYDLLEQLLSTERKKQKMTSESVALINQKCHDLKYQIEGLRKMQAGPERDEYIEQIEVAVQIFESAVKTGNETLDLILMEKLLYCQTHAIKLTCIADGECLNSLDIMDIYTLFGNALDNAIESVSQEEDADKRIISMRIRKHEQFLLIHIENFLGHEVVLKNGLPLTSKEDDGYHGFGVLSILYTVKKYNGTMSIRTDKELFRLDIMIPIADTITGNKNGSSDCMPKETE